MAARAKIAIGKDVETPNSRPKAMAKKSPARTVGLRPIRSERAPQGTAVMHWQMEKMADVKPTHLAISLSWTARKRIISGYKITQRYNASQQFFFIRPKMWASFLH